MKTVQINKIKILCLSFLMVLPMLSSAQYKTLDFYYISHDYSTRVDAVCEILEEKYEAALEFDDCSLIFYLPNGEEPLILKMNLPGDNRDDFDDFMGELRGKYSHDSYVYVDLPRIVELFNEVDFIDDAGQKNFSSFEINWFINSSFWSMNYNESLIASLYFILELDKYKDYVEYIIWNAGDGAIDIDRTKVFGSKNLPGNYPFHLLPL